LFSIVFSAQKCSILPKGFLDALTPKEFFEEQRQKKLARQEARRRQRVKAKQAAWEKSKATKMDEFEAKKVRSARSSSFFFFFPQ
jgi:hypothetical protein